MTRSVFFAQLELKTLSGTVINTRAWAGELARRGWQVGVFAREGDEAKRLLREAGIPVSTDIATIAHPPDVIHFSHHPAAVPLLLRCPDTPAVHMCQDADVWFEQPLSLERIRRRLAVDAACRDRILMEAGPEAGEVELSPNTVDLRRFPERATPLPKRPRRALIVANREGQHVPTLEAACAAAGIETTTAGYGVGRPYAALETAMAEADVVFGAARIALEGMAAGAAVVVCDHRGLAGMATTEVFDRWRADNFGRRILGQAITPGTVRHALEGYDAADAAAVTGRVRAEAAVERQVDQLERAYEEAIALQKARPHDRRKELAQIAQYLSYYLPGHSPNPSTWSSERAAFRARELELLRERDALAARLETRRPEPAT